MFIQPLVPSVKAVEGGGTNGKRDDGGDNGGMSSSGSGDSLAMVCIELALGNLQRNLTLIAMTIDSPTATGNQEYVYM